MFLKKLLNDIFLNTFSVAILRFSNVAILIYFSHNTSVQDYAFYGVSFNYISIASSLCVLGIGTYYVNNLSQSKFVNVSAGIYFILTLSLLMVLLTLIFSSFISDHLYLKPELKSWLVSSALLILLYSIYNIMISILQGKLRYKYIARIQTVFGLLTVILQFLFFMYYGMMGAIYGLMLSLLIMNMVNMVYLFKVNDITFIVKLRTDDLCSFLKEIFPYSISALIVLPSSILTQIFISRYSTNIELSTYQVMLYWQNIFLFFSSSISVVILTRINKHKNEIRNKRKFFLLSIIFINAVLIFTIPLVLLFSKYVYLLYGNVITDRFFIIYPYIFFVVSLNAMYIGQWMYTLGLIKKTITVNALWLTIYIIILIILKFFLNVEAFKISYFAFYFSYIVQSLLMCSYIYKRLSYRE